jgi:hypothetical protein
MLYLGVYTHPEQGNWFGVACAVLAVGILIYVVFSWFRKPPNKDKPS